MMTREEQIKEITMLTCPAYCRNKEKKCAGILECDMKCLYYQRCEIVYDNANYRKQEKAEWIVTEKEDYWIPDITVKSTRPVYKCSACEKEFGLIASKYSYCPNCGAEIVGRK